MSLKLLVVAMGHTVRGGPVVKAVEKGMFLYYCTTIVCQLVFVYGSVCVARRFSICSEGKAAQHDAMRGGVGRVSAWNLRVGQWVLSPVRQSVSGSVSLQSVM